MFKQAVRLVRSYHSARTLRLMSCIDDAQMNAIMNKNAASLAGASIYVTMYPCNECAKLIIQVSHLKLRTSFCVHHVGVISMPKFCAFRTKRLGNFMVFYNNKSAMHASGGYQARFLSPRKVGRQWPQLWSFKQDVQVGRRRGKVKQCDGLNFDMKLSWYRWWSYVSHGIELIPLTTPSLGPLGRYTQLHTWPSVYTFNCILKSFEIIRNLQVFTALSLSCTFEDFKCIHVCSQHSCGVYCCRWCT